MPRLLAAAALLLLACGSGVVPVPPPPDAATHQPAEPPPGRVVWDLLANRPLASVTVSGNLILDAASPDFWKWIDGGWKASWFPGERDGEHAVALVAGIAGVVRFPVDETLRAAGDLRLHFVARPAVAGQALTVFYNERAVQNLTLVDGYQSYEVTLPRSLLARGDQTVRFQFRAAGTLGGRHTAAAFERIAVGPKGARDPGAPPRLGASYGIGGEVRRALASPQPARFSYFLEVPPATRLRFGYGTQSPAAAGVRFAVRAQADGGAARSLWAAPAESGWQRATVDLAPVAGQAVRLDLEVEGGGGAFAEPQLIADAPRRPRPHVRAAEHVLVWMVDTLRADRLSAYAPKSHTRTPGFDQLAREATRFAATVQGNYSLPSHTSLLTGTYPSVHRMNDDKDRLAEALPLASQVFEHAGFATALFSSNGYISDKWGFKKGWSAYRNFIREDLPNSADQVWKAAKPWLAEQVKSGRRTFMYLATVDPHVAYNPPERFLAPYWPKSYRGPVKPALTSQQLYQIKLGKLKLGVEDKRYLEALYDAEVTQNDATFVQVVADLKQLGIYDKTALVVVSDHGDEFFDHGSVGHGHSLYQELIDVPLLVRWPPTYPEAKAVPDAVEVIDLYSSLLEVAGLDVNSEAQGAPLSDLALDDGPRAARSAESFHGSAIRSLRVGRWKLLIWSGGKVALYDLAADPRETKDLSVDHPIALRMVRDVFAYQNAYGERWRKGRWGSASDLKPAFADDIGM